MLLKYIAYISFLQSLNQQTKVLLEEETYQSPKYKLLLQCIENLSYSKKQLFQEKSTSNIVCSKSKAKLRTK